MDKEPRNVVKEKKEDCEKYWSPQLLPYVLGYTLCISSPSEILSGDNLVQNFINLAGALVLGAIVFGVCYAIDEVTGKYDKEWKRIGSTILAFLIITVILLNF